VGSSPSAPAIPQRLFETHPGEDQKVFAGFVKNRCKLKGGLKMRFRASFLLFEGCGCARRQTKKIGF
jgi:hypothetical protein